jgi:hypothetical protein
MHGCIDGLRCVERLGDDGGLTLTLKACFTDDSAGGGGVHGLKTTELGQACHEGPGIASHRRTLANTTAHVARSLKKREQKKKKKKKRRPENTEIKTDTTVNDSAPAFWVKGWANEVANPNPNPSRLFKALLLRSGAFDVRRSACGDIPQRSPGDSYTQS